MRVSVVITNHDYGRFVGEAIESALAQTHEGQGAAINAGFAAATGDALIFLDADDLLLPGAAAEVARMLTEPGVAKVQWPMLLADETGRPTGALYPEQPLED